MKKGYIPKDQRKKILFLCDDIRLHSGIGTMAREIVLNTAHHYNWVNLGAAIKHPEQGQAFDLSPQINETIGISDASVKVIPWDGYGNSQILRQLLAQEKPDVILHFTDPRYWTWLYRMEKEIRTKIPIAFYTIWDDLPYPMYNRDYYRSDDLLLCISKQTKNLVENVLRDYPKEDWQVQYVPHGIDENKFFPIINDLEFETFKEKFFEEKEYDFVVFWNNRNIRRKNPGDVITAWRIFTDQLSKEQAERCLLLMHTDPVDSNGTDIPAVIETMCDSERCKVKFTNGKCDEKILNYYYNLADAQFMMTDNEGWGLSLTEGLMAGNMIIAPVQGGMQDQMRFEDENGDWINFSTEFPTNSNGRYKKHGEWAVPMFGKTRSLKGSPPTPYIYATQVDIEDAGLALLKCYNLGREEIQKRGLVGRKWLMSEESNMTVKGMGDGFIKNIDILLENWEPIERFDIEKVEEKITSYNEHPVQYTPEFKEKLKEVLK
jgi:glycosyltransferase involved in cell wall biosynthesis